MDRSAHPSDGDHPDPADPPDDDRRIDEMVAESFPASDPPTGWAGEDPRDVLAGSGSDRIDPPEDRGAGAQDA